MNNHTTDNRLSILGIQYQQIVPSGLISVFIQAEREWLQNTDECYDVDASRVWAGDTVPRLVTGALEAVDIDDLRRYVPGFLNVISQHQHPESLSDQELRERISAQLWPT